MDLEKERVAFERWFWSKCDILNSSTRFAHTLSEDSWISRAKLAHQETQALQQELNTLKAQLKGGVIVPREPSEEMLRILNDGLEIIDHDHWYFHSEDAYKAMIETMESND